ncbi:MAG TPA: hypothetical protein VNL18_03900 [Gemmatimonadales bacterium]|nr:hypothetical protein [Gemmatimonadales bacterium]
MKTKTGVTLAAVILGLSMTPANLLAQQAMDSRWLPWLGCWRAGAESETPDVVVCVRPSLDDNGIEIATIENGQVASSRIIVADGERRAIADEDCSGWQSATFSADGRRVFLRSELTCTDDARRTGSGIMAIASPDEWLDAQAVGLGSERAPRVSWYRAATGADAPEGFEASAQRMTRAAEARLLASAELSLEDVREAAEHVDPEALVAFLIERNQVFDLDADDVAALADAGVPNDVIDVLVAVSYPGRFAIDRQAMRASWQPDPPSERRGGRRGYGDPFGWGWWGRGGYFGACFSGLYWSFYCPGLYSPYYGGAYGWYDPYWYGGGYWRPVIVVRDRTSGSQAGRAAGGRGYTRGGDSAGGGRTAKPRSGGSQSSSGGSSASVSGGSSGAGQASPGGYSRGGGGGGSSGASAKPRGR